MDKKDELQNKLKVELQPREVNLIGLAQKLKEQEMLYNNNTQSTREDILRGSENTILNMYAYAGLLLSINELYGGVVDTKITSRKKSIVSARRKENRPDREGKKTKDTIGSTICIERVHNSMNFSNFFDDDKIQAEYNERMQNIDLMKIVIDFLESLPMETISSELDNATPQEDSESISKLKEKREEVKENVKVYYKESRKEDDEIIRMDKTKLIREICQSLTEEEIHKAETNGIESLLEELNFYNINQGALFPELEHQMAYIKYSMCKSNVRSASSFEKIDFDAIKAEESKESVEIAESVVREELVDKAIYDIISQYISDDAIKQNVLRIITRQTEYIDWANKEATISDLRRKIKRSLSLQSISSDVATQSARNMVSQLVNLYVKK